ncbi:MAG: hypothetical protein GIW94_03965 [Candidatus Eremiobacteraeota bacterium]|nr:hypothetical protein [Candidatus Eremiobacteraeota bacterium]MBC5821692.1 hypothetical protein [Candidatus Eremiobacteraeota bacterium]
MTASTGILIAGLFFAAAGFAGTLFGSGEKRPGPQPLAQAAVRMGLTIVCGAAGAFAASRALPVDRIVVAAAVMASLSAAVYAGAVGRPASFYAVLVPLVVVGLSATLDSAWMALVSGIVAAIPFGISAALFPRSSSVPDALFCALAGATLGLMPAFFVLFGASLATVGVAAWKRRPASTVRFAPYVAAFTLIALLGNLSLAV